jgi:hypothetical protein
VQPDGRIGRADQARGCELETPGVDVHEGAWIGFWIAAMSDEGPERADLAHRQHGRHAPFPIVVPVLRVKRQQVQFGHAPQNDAVALCAQHVHPQKYIPVRAVPVTSLDFQCGPDTVYQRADEAIVGDTPAPARVDGY